VQEQLLRRYQDKKGRIKLLPHKPGKQLTVLAYLASKFEPGRMYGEKEINQILNENHSFNDPALLRRELVEKSLLERTEDGKKYWLSKGEAGS
jgi:hypothetical protein